MVALTTNPLTAVLVPVAFLGGNGGGAMVIVGVEV
jgi:hypothetical protein